MHIALSICSQAIILLALCGTALGRLIAKKRDVCVNDDFLLSFVEYPSDTIPFCIVYLGIQDVTTSAILATARTTTINTGTTTATVVQTITVPAVTEYETSTVSQLRKRGPEPNGAALVMRDLGARNNTPQNSAIISGVSSACSCLHITPNTVTLPATAYLTRTEDAIDYEKEIDFVTVTGGTTTVLVTLTSSLPSYTASVPTQWNATTVPSTSFSAGTSYSTSTPLSTISTVITISTSSDTTSPTWNSSEIPTSLPSESSTPWVTTLPTSSAVYGTATPPFNTSDIPKTGSETSTPTEASSVAVSSSSLPTTSWPTTTSGGVIPTSVTMPNHTTLTYGLSSISTISTSILSSSAIVSGSPIYPSTNTSSTASGFPLPVPTNATATSTGPAEPTDTAVGCPAINNTILTYSDQQFRVVCYTDYGGSTTIGLNEPNFRACVQECAIANDGFSSARCRGVTFFPNNTGADCYLKTPAAVAVPESDPSAISALLINTTSSASGSIPSIGSSTSMNYSSTAGSTAPSSSGISWFVPSLTSNFSATAGPTGLSSSTTNVTSAWTTSSIAPSNSNDSSTVASITPSPSLNATSVASVTPSASYNDSLTLNISSTESKTTSLPTGNSSCALATGTVTTTSVSVVMSTETATVTATVPWWRF